MKRISLTLLLVLFMRALSWAQGLPGTYLVGTCDQYQPGPGGALCINNGSTTGWYNTSGDVMNIHGTPQCSPLNNTQCGKMIVDGLDGIPFFGMLSPSLPVWCLSNDGTQLIPCVGGGVSAFASFTRIVSGSVATLPDSTGSIVTTIEVTEEHSATQTLPICATTNKFYVVWETNASPGGYTPTFAPPAGWTLVWPSGGLAPTGTNTTTGLTDFYEFQCDLPNKLLVNQGFVPANTSFASCKGSVTLSGGSGTFSNACVTSSCVPVLRDTTTYTNSATAGAVSAGSLAITGTGSDVILAVCL
jgi:hypothetical protein